MCEPAFFDLAQIWVYKFKAYLTLLGVLSLTLFYLLQTVLIERKMRGTYLSVHFLVLKVIFDAFQMFFVWSRHLHDSGQESSFKNRENAFDQKGNYVAKNNRVKPL